nr:AlpA family phage regulatory protein [Jezberella montanilacus]
MIPLADTQIYDMERRGEFSRRFNLTPRYVVWTPTAAWMPPKKRTSPVV